MAQDVRSGAGLDVLLLAPALLLAAVAREVAPPARGEVRDDLATVVVLLLCVAAWALARRLDLPRWAAAAGVVLVPLCPPVQDAAAAGDLTALTACVLLVAGLAAVAAGVVSTPGLVTGVVALAGAVALDPALLGDGNGGVVLKPVSDAMGASTAPVDGVQTGFGGVASRPGDAAVRGGLTVGALSTSIVLLLTVVGRRRRPRPGPVW